MECNKCEYYEVCSDNVTFGHEKCPMTFILSLIHIISSLKCELEKVRSEIHG